MTQTVLTVVVPSFYGLAEYDVGEEVEVEGGVRYRVLKLSKVDYYDGPPGDEENHFPKLWLHSAERLGL